MDAPNLPEYRPVYRALHRPLTVCGVDRRLFFLALLVGAATFNLFYSFLAGCLLFARPLRVRAGGARRTTRRCSRSCCGRAEPDPLRRREARPRRRADAEARHGERQSHSQGLPGRRQR